MSGAHQVLVNVNGNGDVTAAMPAAGSPLNAAIDRVEVALEQARSLPEWTLPLGVLAGLLFMVFLLHVAAVIVFLPCLCRAVKRRAAAVKLSDMREGDVGSSKTPRETSCGIAAASDEEDMDFRESEAVDRALERRGAEAERGV